MTKPAKLAFVAPRFPEGGTVGGAETLLKNVAERAARRGHEVDFLTTCARSHFSWENELPAGERRIGAVNVHFFPVDAGRQVDLFLRIQGDISRRKTVSREE